MGFTLCIYYLINATLSDKFNKLFYPQLKVYFNINE